MFKNFDNYKRVLLFSSFLCFVLFLITPIPLPEFDANQKGNAGIDQSSSFDCQISLQGAGLVNSPVLNGWKTNLELPAGFSQVKDNLWKTIESKQLNLKSDSFLNANQVIVLDLNPEVVSRGSARGYHLLAQGKFFVAANQILESLYTSTIAWVNWMRCNPSKKIG